MNAEWKKLIEINEERNNSKRRKKREKIGKGKEIGERRIIEWEVEKIKWNK